MQKDYQYFILYKVSSVLLITKTINLDDNKIQTTINIYNVHFLYIICQFTPILEKISQV
jgi:hypothetical protein